MKQIVGLYAILFALIISGCATLNPTPTVEAPKEEHVTVNLPKWPVYAYQHKDPDIIIIMAIKDPSIKAPGAFVLTDEEKKLAYKVQMVVPNKK